MMRRSTLIFAALACFATAKKAIVVPGWPVLKFPFSTAIVDFKGTLHMSGMQGFDFKKNPPSRVQGGIEAEAKQTMDNFAEIMAAARNATMSDIVECTVLLADLKDFDAFNKVYAAAFTDGVYPTRIASEGTLFGGAAVEVKCMADVSQYFTAEELRLA